MTWWEPTVAVAGLVVGVVVGLTGMGGGALMTPVLVFFFGVHPLAAVSSDVVASFFMKPIGGLVHLRRGTVHLGIVRWLCLGSVPAAFTGVLLLRVIGRGGDLEKGLLIALGTVLVLASLALTAKSYLKLRERQHRRLAGERQPDQPLASVPVRRLATVLVGVGGGLVVGMTSVGAGSLMIVCLLLLYPRIQIRQLVGTDLVQAIPLVASASVRRLHPRADRQHPRRRHPGCLAGRADLLPLPRLPGAPGARAGDARLRRQAARRLDRTGAGPRGRHPRRWRGRVGVGPGTPRRGPAGLAAAPPGGRGRRARAGDRGRRPCGKSVVGGVSAQRDRPARCCLG
jgi:uncharacterized membrane protein YfcA